MPRAPRQPHAARHRRLCPPVVAVAGACTACTGNTTEADRSGGSGGTRRRPAPTTRPATPSPSASPPRPPTTAGWPRSPRPPGEADEATTTSTCSSPRAPTTSTPRSARSRPSSTTASTRSCCCPSTARRMTPVALRGHGGRHPGHQRRPRVRRPGRRPRHDPGRQLRHGRLGRARTSAPSVSDKPDAVVAEVAGIDSLPLTQDRSQGFADALADCGLDVDNRVAARLHRRGRRGGHGEPAAGRAADRRHLEPRRRPGRRRAGRDRRTPAATSSSWSAAPARPTPCAASRPATRVLQGHRHLPAPARPPTASAGPPARPGQGARRPGRGRGAPPDQLYGPGRHRRQRRPVHRQRVRVLSPPGCAARPAPRSPEDRHEPPATGRVAHDRPRLHGRGPLAGLAHRPPLLRPTAAAASWPCSCGRDADRTAEAARRGWAGPPPRPTGGEVIDRDDVDLVDICTPGDTHAEIAIAALEAGKHVLCEKPLANTVAEAEAMTAAAARPPSAGVRAMVGFTYRRVPAIAPARQLVADGPARRQCGTCGPQYLQDWIADPQAPHVVAAGEGQGRLRGAGRHRRARRRPDPAHHRRDRHRGQRRWRRSSRSARCPPAAGRVAAPPERARARSPSTTPRCSWPGSPAAALAIFEATRFALGRKNAIRIEINGSAGSLAFDFEDMNVLHFFDGPEPDRDRRLPPDRGHRARAPLRRRLVAAGHGLGYEHAFTHQVVDLRQRDRRPASDPTPSFADGLQVSGCSTPSSAASTPAPRRRS